MYERNKDRLSYSHGNIQFDLTQVKSPVSQRHCHCVYSLILPISVDTLFDVFLGRWRTTGCYT